MRRTSLAGLLRRITVTLAVAACTLSATSCNLTETLNEILTDLGLTSGS